jgi:hypothetical protein
VTIEPQDAILKCYPNIVEEFETLRNAKKKNTSRSKKDTKLKYNAEEPHEMKKIETKRRGKRKPVEVANNKKIVEFFTIENREPILEKSFEKLEITPKRKKKSKDLKVPNIRVKRGPQFDRVMNVERLDSILNGSLELMFNQLTPEDFASDIDNSIDMSLIINNICNRKGDRQNISLNYKNDNVTQKGKNGIYVVDEEISKDIQKTEEIDEFDILNETYVPLDVRLYSIGKGKENQIKDLNLLITKNNDRFSLGIDSLLNGTDD